MPIEDLANMGTHGLMVVAIVYLLIRLNKVEILLIKCMGGDKPDDADLQSLDKLL